MNIVLPKVPWSTSNLPREYNSLFMGTTTTTKTTICKNIRSSTTTTNTRVCHRPKLFFLKKRPPFATMDGWNPITEYRINLFEPPTTMEGMDRGWGEVRGHLGDNSSNNTNYNNTAPGGGDFGNGNYSNIGTAAAAAAADATIDNEGGRGGSSSKSTIETASTVRAGNKISVVTYSTNSINDNSEGGGGGGNGGGSGRTMSSSPVQWAWSRLTGGALTPKSSKDLIK